MVVERKKKKKKILILEEVPNIADMDFMGARKTRIVISESAVVKKTFCLDGYYIYYILLRFLTPRRLLVFPL